MADSLEKTTTQRLIETLKSFIDWNENVKITEDARFKEDLGMDSLDRYELVYRVEEEFDISIPDGNAGELKTIKDYVEYIEAHKF
jgi:acyl carrier protein